MFGPRLVRSALAAAGVIALAASGVRTYGQTAGQPTNDAANPYQSVENNFKLPEGRTWGSTSAVDIDKDGTSIWVGERCGANLCWNAQAGAMSPLDVVLKFDATGKLVKSFGAGMVVFPHGMHVDRDGNIWVTDGRDNLPQRGRGAAADAPLPAPPGKVIGHQIYKFSPDGRLLLTLGKPGGNQPGQPGQPAPPADPASFYQPNDVITNAAGDIFVCEGHSSNATATARISKFDKTGKFIKAWGKWGKGGAGEFDQPHAFALDSKGRLFIADRGNNRIQIYDQDGNHLETGWEQFSRISGLWIDKSDTLYAADSESGSIEPERPEWKRGIRIGKVSDKKVLFFIPDPVETTRNTSAAEGIAVDAKGNIYGAEVGPKALKRYVKK
jgi:sugar lactone lactonase YvrE